MRIKLLPILSLVLLIAGLAACDLRSGTAKEEMEKYEPRPTPPIVAKPTSTPAEPADIANVDTTLDGDLLSANGNNQNTTRACTKFNRLLINGDDGVITVKGACRQIMINGDRNKITADATVEFVFNGNENVVKYTRFANGKEPSVIGKRDGNEIEKISADAMTTGKPQHTIVK